MSRAKIEDWICTDGDNEQYGRKISDRVYTFKELEREFLGSFSDEEIIGIFDSPQYWEEQEINLDEYSQEEVEKYISAYYTDLNEVFNIYGDDSNWIIAECIFEQKSGNY